MRAGTKLTAAALVRYSIALGATALARSDGEARPWRSALERIWMPLDVDRVVELPWAGRSVAATRPRRVLDAASPKLLACWLAELTGAVVTATDVWDREVESWRRLTTATQGLRERLERLRLETADVTRLPYDDATFDAAYSVSVIEHLADDGDRLAMAELERVLCPGATLALTFPCRRDFELEYVDHDLYGQPYEGSPIFFQRHYSLESVRSRLVDGRAFEVLEQGLWRKQAVSEAQAGLRRVLPAGLAAGRLLGPLLPVIGARAMTPADVARPGPANVMRLLLRRR